MKRPLLACLVLFVASFGCPPAGQAAEARLPHRPLPCPAGADSGESSLVRAPDGTVILTWAEPGRTPDTRALKAASLAPDKAGWTEPRLIIESPLLMENWADFASLVVGDDGTWTVQWFQRHAEEGRGGYEGWFARSTDRGETWSTPAELGHEFVALAPLGGGRVLAVWLESARIRDPNTPRVRRDPNAPRPTKDPNAPYAPSMRLRGRLLDAEGKTLGDWIIDPDTCTCCQTTLTVLPHGRALVAYRGHLPDEVRDNYVSVFTGNGWTPPQRLHEDGWKIPACPVNGPAADALEEQVSVAWFTAAQGVARVQAKISRNGGERFGPALPIDLGRPIGRLDLVTLADGSSVVSWLESAAGANAAGLYLRRLFPDGQMSEAKLLAPMSAVRASGFPRLAARPGPGLPVVVTWTDAVPHDTDPKAPAVTRILTAEFSAQALPPRSRLAARTPRPPLLTAVVRGNDITFLEWCAPDAQGNHPAVRP